MLIHSLNTYTLLNFTDIQPWWVKPKVAKVSAADIKKDPTNNWGICLTCFRQERYHIVIQYLYNNIIIIISNNSNNNDINNLKIIIYF